MILIQSGQVLSQSTNEGYEISDDEAKSFASMSYQVALATKASVKQHVLQEEVQFLRVRMKQSEALIVPGMLHGNIFIKIMIPFLIKIWN